MTSESEAIAARVLGIKNETNLALDGKLWETLVSGDPVFHESDIEACRRIFGGRKFTCRGFGCLKEIEWIGACDDCLARIEKEARTESDIIDDRLTGIGVPIAKTRCSWDTWRANATSMAADVLELNRAALKLKEWVGDPPLIVITGPSGTGKTHLAVAVVRKFITDNGYSRSVRFWSEFSLVEAVKSSYGGGDDVLPAVVSADLLVLDDFGSVQSSDWSSGMRAGMLNARIDNGRWTILTTNLNQTEINNVDERLASRTRDALIINTCAAPDKRGAADF
jgi:DNA replication protein DnaC